MFASTRSRRGLWCVLLMELVPPWAKPPAVPAVRGRFSLTVRPYRPSAATARVGRCCEGSRWDQRRHGSDLHLAEPGPGLPSRSEGVELRSHEPQLAVRRVLVERDPPAGRELVEGIGRYAEMCRCSLRVE